MTSSSSELIYWPNWLRHARPYIRCTPWRIYIVLHIYRVKQKYRPTSMHYAHIKDPIYFKESLTRLIYLKAFRFSILCTCVDGLIFFDSLLFCTHNLLVISMIYFSFTVIWSIVSSASWLKAGKNSPKCKSK
jgi:hypothetical protein